MKVSDIAEIVLPPKFSNKTPDIDKLKKSVKFAQYLSEILNNANNSTQIKSEKPVEEFKPRLDLITSLSLPLERRCKVCGKPISSGEYCDKCGKQLVGKNYV